MLTLASDIGDILPVLGLVGGLTIAVIAIVANTIRRVVRTKAREESRREIAAYVAEGSITPMDAAKLMAAGERPNQTKCDA